MASITVKLFLWLLSAVFVLPEQAFAACVCRCMDGQMLPACTNPFDIAPICEARPCAYDISPMRPPESTSPWSLPLGRRSCRLERVCDIHGRCVTKEQCR